MGWKNWPYWLKGGIISVGLVFVSSLFTFVRIGMYSDANAAFWESGIGYIILILSQLFSWPLSIMMFISYLILYAIFGRNNIFFSPGGTKFPIPTVAGYILNTILVYGLFFCIGAFIGWIVGIIKSKKK